MSTPTYEKIQHIELTSESNLIQFSSIPSTFTDLVIVTSIRSTRSGNPSYIGVYCNGSTTNQTVRRLWGDGSARSSSTESNNWAMIIPGTNYTSNTFASAQIYIPNYTSSANKSFSVEAVSENNGTQSYQVLTAGLWSTSSAVSSVELRDPSGNFVVGSSATLYGIKSIPSAPKATGGIISYVNGYWVHTFTSSGTFTPTQNLTADVLVVAGGGGGGSFGGGGGGAGGLVYATGESLTSSTNYTVTVGAGGSGQATPNRGVSGSNSVFNTYTANGGGGGGSWTDSTSRNGIAGGSGGGGSEYAGSGTGGASNQTSYSGKGFGNSGGNGDATTGAGAGGGGAGSAGTNGASSGNGGAGGSGATYSITGSSISYAGGGGGGAAGGSNGTATDGGGAGGGTSAVANRGGGGGGNSRAAGFGGVGGNGGSGIVIVRYQ